MKKILILLMSLGLLLAMVMGCGDDETTPTEPEDLQTGSIDDPGFQLAQEAVDNAEDFSDEMFDRMERIIDSVFFMKSQLSAAGNAVTGSAADEVFLVYNEDSDYWFLYFEGEETIYGQGDVVEDIVTITLFDSIQFLHGLNPVQWPDSALLTGIANGAALAVTTQSGLGNANATQQVTIEGAPGEIAFAGDVILDGIRTFDLGLTNEGGSCVIALEATATATEIALNITDSEEGACPQSGNLVHVATISIECTGDTTFSFSDTWTFDQTFFGDTIQVVVENTTTRWTFTDTCDITGPAARPYAEIFARLREK